MSRESALTATAARAIIVMSACTCTKMRAYCEAMPMATACSASASSCAVRPCLLTTSRSWKTGTTFLSALMSTSRSWMRFLRASSPSMRAKAPRGAPESASAAVEAAAETSALRSPGPNLISSPPAMGA